MEQHMCTKIRQNDFRPFFVSHFVSLKMSKTNRYQHTVIPPPFILSCIYVLLPILHTFLQKTCCDVSIVSHEKHSSATYCSIWRLKTDTSYYFFFHFLGKSCKCCYTTNKTNMQLCIPMQLCILA